MSAQVRVKGHTLPFEGRVRSVYRYGSGPGHGRCSCGAASADMLPSTAARQRWHRQHKSDVLAAVVRGPAKETTT